MATPGYPQMGQPQMPGMGGMGGIGNMPPMQPPRPPHRGTSRAVPVVVSAGLAVGVFCGLLFGLGTGDKADAKGSTTGNNLKHETPGQVDPNALPVGTGATIGKQGVDKIANGSAAGSGSAGGGIGSAMVAMAGTGSGSAAGSAAPKTMKLTIDVDPDVAATTAVIKIDGKAITGKSTDVPPDTKQVHVQITADGYHSIDENVDVAGTSGDEHDVKIKMIKRAASSGTSSPGFGGASSGGNHVPTAPPKPPKKPANTGIIDI
jgi:hypothetical protein